MKLAAVIIFGLALQSSATVTYSQQRISLDLKNVSVQKVLKTIENRSDYRFVYGDDVFQSNKLVNVYMENATIDYVMEQLLAGTELSYNKLNENLVIVIGKEKQQSLAIPIKGTVTDELGGPLSGVSIVEKGTTIGAVTDDQGRFVIEISGENVVLEISRVGYETREVTVSGSGDLNVILKAAQGSMQEVVVVGFGSQKKVNLTGAVASVDTKTLESRPVSSAVQALQGVVPGLNINVSNQGNKLDANPSINIRGTGNLGTGSSASPLVLIDGVEGNLNTINPQDIANISVLKDAASAAIYGSRAPFGVVLVTTKSGQKGKTSISYNNNFRCTRPTNIPDMLDSYRFVQYYNQGAKNRGDATPMFPDDVMQRIKDFMDGKITETSNPAETQGGQFFPFNMRANDNQNWPRNFIDKTSLAQEHNLGLSGGSERIKYYLSGAFLAQDGQMNFSKEKRNRYNVTGKITGDVNSWLSLYFNSRFIRDDITMPSFLKVYGDRFFAETTKLFPMMPLYDNNGHYTRNPKLMQLDYGGRSNSLSDNYFTQGGFTITPMKGWGIYGQAALNTVSYQHGYAINKVYLYSKTNQPVEEAWLGGDPDLAAGKTSFQSQTSQSSLTTTSLYTDYEFALGANNFKAMVGMNSESYIVNSLMGKRFDLVDEKVPSINTATGFSSNSGGQDHWATLGYFARLNYDYDGRYLVEFNVRRDGTSRFRGEKRWGVFPSFSLGWNMARENFWEPLREYVSTFKPRFSYGSLGNQNTDNWYPTYSIQNIIVGTPDQGGRWLLGDGSNKSNIASSPGLVSSLLTWERITSYNYGVDFGAIRNRLTGYFDYFVRNTTDMVGPAEEISPIVGAGAPRTNNTSIQTKGWEFEIGWRDRVGELGYNATFNLSDSRTWVTAYPNPGRSLGNYYIGQELGEIWGYQTIGIAKTDEEMNAYLAQHDQSRLAQGQKIWKAGDIMYANLDDDPAITSGENTVDKPGDRRIIGNSNPRYRFGFVLGADYKGFDFRMLLQGVAKRDYWLGGMIFWGIDGNDQFTSTGYEEHWNFFRPEGDPLGANLNAYYPRPIFGNNQNHYPQTGYLQNAAYIRLKNLQVGYTLPQSLTNKISVQKVRLFFSGDNLWTGTKISKNFDPELLYQNGMTYPLARTLSCGLNITL